MTDKSQEQLKELKQFTLPYRERLINYGIDLKVELSQGFVKDEDNVCFRILANDYMVSDMLPLVKSEDRIMDFDNMFRFFSTLESRNYDKIMRDRAFESISNALSKHEVMSYVYFDPESGGDDWDVCPSVRASIDEIHITDDNIYDFLIHSISKDNNGNIKLVGRINNDTMYTYADEYYTYLGSVLPADLEVIVIPEQREQAVTDETEEEVAAVEPEDTGEGVLEFEDWPNEEGEFTELITEEETENEETDETGNEKTVEEVENEEVADEVENQESEEE